MQIPFDGKKSYQYIYKHYKNTPLWIVHKDKFGIGKVKKCYLYSIGNLKIPIIMYKDGALNGMYTPVTWEMLYTSEDSANEELKAFQKLYSENFDFKPYINPQTMSQYRDTLLEIQDTIHFYLKDFPNFLGIDFCDVSAFGIQIRGYHKNTLPYTFIQTVLKYDFSNKEEATQNFIGMWKLNDVPKVVTEYQEFLAEGEKYGWD